MAPISGQRRDNSIVYGPMLVQPSMTSGYIGGSTQGGGNSSALAVQPPPPHTVPSIHLNGTGSQKKTFITWDDLVNNFVLDITH